MILAEGESYKIQKMAEGEAAKINRWRGGGHQDRNDR